MAFRSHTTMAATTIRGFRALHGFSWCPRTYPKRCALGGRHTIAIRMSATATQKKLPYVLSLTKETQTVEPIGLSVKGSMPPWIKGSLYRNGGGVYKIGDTTFKHLFDGMALVHKYSIQDGRVLYQNRLVDSNVWTASVKANRLVASQVGTAATPDPCHNVFQRFFSYFKPDLDTMDNTLVNVVKHGDKLVTMTETPVVNLVDPDSLKTTQNVNLADAVAVHLATAHPHFDEDGTMYNLGTSFNYAKAYNIVQIPPPSPGEENPFKTARLLATVPSRWKLNLGYNHSFGMTQNYFVLLEQPVCFYFPKLIYLGMAKKPGVGALVSHKGHKGIFHLIRRKDGCEVDIKFTTDFLFCFHFVNCYEDGDHVVVDLIGYDSAEIWDELQTKDTIQIKAERKGKFYRFVLPLNPQEKVEGNLVTLENTSATAVQQAKGNIHLTKDLITEGGVCIELPRINYDYNARKYRYAYGIDHGDLSQLLKVDLKTKSVLSWGTRDADYMVGEPVFLPRPGAVEEDDGVVLSPVLSNTPEKGAFLLVLDGQTFQEVARAELPPGVIVPMTFHGSFLPNTGL